MSDPLQTAAGLEQLLVLHRRAIGADALLRRKLTVYARLCNCLGVFYLKRNQLEEARFFLRKAEALTQKMPLLRSSVYNNLGILMRRSNRLRGALDYLQKALAIEQRFAAGEIGGPAPEELGGEEEGEAEGDVNPATTHLNVAAVLSRLGRHLAAMEHAKRAVDILHHELGARPGPPPEEARRRQDRVSCLGVAYFNLGAELEHLGRLQAAEEAFETGHQLTRGALGEDHALPAALARSAASLRRVRPPARRLPAAGAHAGPADGGRRLPLEALQAQVRTNLRSVERTDFPLENRAALARGSSAGLSRRVSGLRAAIKGRGGAGRRGTGSSGAADRRTGRPSRTARAPCGPRPATPPPLLRRPARARRGALGGAGAPRRRAAGPEATGPELDASLEAALAPLHAQPVRPRARGPMAAGAGRPLVRELLADSGSESEGERAAARARPLDEAGGEASEADASWAIFDRELERLRSTLASTIQSTAHAMASGRPGSATSAGSRPRSAASHHGLL
eukprot:tig00001339_g8260.t1